MLDRYLVAQARGTRAGELWLEVTLFVLRSGQGRSELIRAISQQWVRRFPGNHLMVFAEQPRPGQQGFEQITFVNARRLGEGAQVRVKLHKLVVEREHPTRHDADTLNAITVPATGTSAEAIYKLQCAAFDVEQITEQFYRRYAELFRAAMARIREENKGIAAFYDDGKLHTFTQRLFGRVMFLYFLQKKGALNGKPNFVSDWYMLAVRDSENFYSSVLEPLFFQTLNEQRKDGVSPKFGRVPYLNGGLFSPDEDDHKGAVYLADEIFDPQSLDGLLYFLNTHNFTIEEDTPLEVEVALDPEMLGKVFENLLEAEERGKTGTFYTPRPVVAFMCREALSAYLERETELHAERLGWLLDEAETGEPARDEQQNERLTHHTLRRPMIEKINGALDRVRVLDPAVGSGAFPLGMLALLVGVRRALYRIQEQEIKPHTPLVEGWKRNFIRDCLYGVDIKREAIEIARLRLWLSLVVDADPFEMEPLPNLDYKLMAGDSLIETFDGVEIYPTRPKEELAQATLLGGDEVRRRVRELRELQAEYFQPDGTAERARLKQRIANTDEAIVEATLRQREADNAERFDRLNKQLANLQGRPVPPALNTEIKKVDHDMQVTRQARADIKAGKPLPFFLYRLHFASVFEEKDGFDIVIANPPYVRSHLINGFDLSRVAFQCGLGESMRCL